MTKLIFNAVSKNLYVFGIARWKIKKQIPFWHSHNPKRFFSIFDSKKSKRDLFQGGQVAQGKDKVFFKVLEFGISWPCPKVIILNFFSIYRPQILSKSDLKDVSVLCSRQSVYSILYD